MRKARIALLTAAIAALIALTGCEYAQGPAGTVIDRDRKYWSATKQWTYKLTVRKPDGTEHEFRVKRDDYSACQDGSAYPNCTEAR